ncbi:alpha/beta superfamily hydrolase [Paraburkholderia atlantica]
MNVNTKKYLIDGPVGKIEVALDLPDDVRDKSAAPRGIALVAHPHPLFGGTMDNKVAQTLARTLVQLNYVTYRSNFRGVGQTQGEHDAGVGERDDLRAVLEHMRADPNYGDLPLVLAGFSFGTVVLSHVAAKLRDEGREIERIVFVGYRGEPLGRRAGARRHTRDSRRSRRDRSDPIRVRLGAAAGTAGRRDSGRRALSASQASHPEAHHRRRLALKTRDARFAGDRYAQTCANRRHTRGVDQVARV